MSSAASASPQVRAATQRVAMLSVATATILIVVKAIAWRASDSIAILASLSDSALDLVASLITLFAVRYAASPPDAEHRFGHGKAEAFSSLMQGGLVFASGALIGREAIVALLNPHPIEHGLAGVVVMIISIVLTLFLITAQSRVLKASGSIAIASDRAHYAADLASNIVALAGVAAATWLGWSFVDAAAGLVVALWLIWGAISVFSDAANQLLDRELPEADRTRIVELATADPRVLGVHQLRTRASGPYVHMQMHADLAADISLAEAHTIMVQAENRLLEAFPAADILIHPDPRGLAEKHGGLFAESAEA
ncbi:cation diffusion facilitator family transporter [uncultured Caulobacter sp.]|uniref:cation diffusion facilitator family transporter n=1 Tax=uncultured Caulobacter sp. TaxID=158749 RepID=UPI0026230A75|nr:cation diffusion facilitator family transporter [uncultured Caulobacter sp.]